MGVSGIIPNLTDWGKGVCPKSWQMNEKQVNHNPTSQAAGECTRAVSRQIMFENDNHPPQIILYLFS